MPAGGLKTYHFHGRALFVADGDIGYRVRAWPNPVAQRRLPHNTWRAFAPEFRLVAPAIRARRTPARDPSGQLQLPMTPVLALPRTKCRVTKAQAFAMLRSTLPEELAAGIENFRNHQWYMILMVQRIGSYAEDLLASNPVLAFALANHPRFARIMAMGERPDLVTGRIGEKQKSILRYTGFPGSKSMVKLLRKVVPASVSPAILDMFRRLVTDEDTCRLLARLDRINAGVVALLCTPHVRPLLDFRLIREVSESRRNDTFGFTAELLAETYGLCAMAVPPYELPRLRSIQHVQDQHEHVAALRWRPYAHRVDGTEVPFPDPPVAGTAAIQPLCSDEALCEEGNKQRNCVGGYARQVRRGRTYIYRVSRPQRATLSIVKHADGSWRRGELKCKCNKSASDATHQAVDRWLSRHTLSTGD